MNIVLYPIKDIIMYPLKEHFIISTKKILLCIHNKNL